MPRRPCGRMSAVIFGFGLLVSCRSKPRPVPPAIDIEQARQWVAQGDARFLESHLHGWRQAEGLYEKAAAASRDESVAEKLRLTRFLILTRQSDEEIPEPGVEHRLASVCEGASQPRLQLLCEVARRRSAPATGPSGGGATPRFDPALFDAEGSALEAYLRRLAAAALGAEQPPAPPDRFKESPLFLYLSFGSDTVRRAAELEKEFPHFAELFEFLGEALFRETRYRGARACFTKAIDLIPDYTRARNGLANIYFFALEEYERALELYEGALAWDPRNTTALFGKGAALHHLNRFADSNFALDRMLESNRARRGRASESSIRYFEAEGCYYKAQNHYAVGDRVRARALVDEAKRILPDSAQASYLSALLFYEDRELEKARDEFASVVRRSSETCNAHYYLGMIGAALKEEKASEHFLRTCSCIEGTVRALGRQIRSVPSLDLEDAERSLMKVKLDKRLAEYRRSSAELVRSMLRAADEPGKNPNPAYQQLMMDLLGRLGGLTERPGEAPPRAP